MDPEAASLHATHACRPAALLPLGAHLSVGLSGRGPDRSLAGLHLPRLGAVRRRRLLQTPRAFLRLPSRPRVLLLRLRLRTGGSCSSCGPFPGNYRAGSRHLLFTTGRSGPPETQHGGWRFVSPAERSDWTLRH